MVLYFLGVDGCDDNDIDKKDAVLNNWYHHKK